MSKIGHNNPPKDRKINWKSISINPYDYEDLKKICSELAAKEELFQIIKRREAIEICIYPLRYKRSYYSTISISRAIRNSR